MRKGLYKKSADSPKSPQTPKNIIFKSIKLYDFWQFCATFTILEKRGTI